MNRLNPTQQMALDARVANNASDVAAFTDQRRAGLEQMEVRRAELIAAEDARLRAVEAARRAVPKPAPPPRVVPGGGGGGSWGGFDPGH